MLALLERTRVSALRGKMNDGEESLCKANTSNSEASPYVASPGYTTLNRLALLQEPVRAACFTTTSTLKHTTDHYTRQ